MKSITEFQMPTLQKFSNAKTALMTAGKTEDEVTASLTETFKMEGDKLKYITAAAELAAGKTNVRRVIVTSFAEGETAPAKYQKVDETHYLVETLEPVKAPAQVAPTKGGGRGGPGGPRKGGGGDRPKSSPWGASPEEVAAKKKASQEAAKRS